MIRVKQLECPVCGDRHLVELYTQTAADRNGFTEAEVGFNDGDIIAEFDCGLLGKVDGNGAIEVFGSCINRRIVEYGFVPESQLV